MTSTSGQISSRESRLAANTVLRAATIGIRAALVIGLAVWLEPAALGIYGVIGATITLTTYFYGLDFYTFTLRVLSTADLSAARYRLRDQFLLFGAIYCIGTIALVVILPFFGLDVSLAVLAAGIAVFQHAALELYRVLLRLEQTMQASLCLFLRDAAWVPFCLIAWLIRGRLGLADVLEFWLAGSMIAFIVATRWFLQIAPSGVSRPFDSSWIVEGLKVGLRMLPGTLSLRGLFTVDRMLLATIATPETLGAYVFFSSLCGAAAGLFESGILPFYWPRVLEAARNGERERQIMAQRALTAVCLIGAFGITLAAVVGGMVLAEMLQHPAYRENVSFLVWIAGAYMAFIISNVPNYRLFAEKRDLAIVLSNVGAFACFVIAAGFLARTGVALTVPVALAGAVVLLLAFKGAAARHYRV